MKKDTYNKPILFTVSLLLTTLLYISFFNIVYLGPIDFNHHGLIIHPTSKILNGELVFKDFDLKYDLGFHYMIAMIFSIFKLNIINLNILTYSIYFLIYVSIFFQSIIFHRFFLGLIAVTILLLINPILIDWMMPWPNIYICLFAINGITFLFLYYNKKKIIFLILFAICNILIFLMREHIGILYIALSIFIISIKKHKSNHVYLILLIYFLFFLILFSFLFFNGIFYDYLKFFEFKFSFLDLDPWKKNELNYIFFLFGTFIPILNPKWMTFNFSYIIPFVLLCFLFSIYLKNNKNYLLYIVLYSLISWSQYFPLNDLHHIYWGLMPLVFMFLLSIDTILRNSILIKYYIYRCLIIFFICALLFQNIIIIYSKNYNHIKNLTARYFDNFAEYNVSDYCFSNNKSHIHYKIKDTCDVINLVDNFYLSDYFDLYEIKNIIVFAPMPLFYSIFDSLSSYRLWYFNDFTLIRNNINSYKIFNEKFNIKNTLIITNERYLKFFDQNNFKIINKYPIVNSRISSKSPSDSSIYFILN